MKRGILGNVVKIYDFLGLVVFIILKGKLLYCEVCEEKCVWDVLLFVELV